MLSIAVAVAFLASASSAGAAVGPVWAVKVSAAPTNFSSADTPSCLAERGCDAYVVTVTNVGAAASTGPVIIRDRLPDAGSGIVAAGLGFDSESWDSEYELTKHVHHKLHQACEVVQAVFRCEYGGEVPPHAAIGLHIEVRITTAVKELVTNRLEVEGGGAAPVVGEWKNTINAPQAPFGIEDFAAGVATPQATPDSRAAAHPSSNITSLNWNTRFDPGEESDKAFYSSSVQYPKTQIVDLPSGFVGDAQSLEHCGLSNITEVEENPGKCPAGSRLGYVALEYDGGAVKFEPLYNVPPEAGYPAEFAFELYGATVTLLPRLLPVQGGYVLSVTLPYLPRSPGALQLEVTGAQVTLFGDPTEGDGTGSGEAFFRNPTDCSAAPLKARLELDSWVEPNNWQSAESTMFEASPTQAVSGCGALQFHPSIDVTPETTETDSPSGYEIDVRVPQAPNVPGDLATPDLKNAVVTLPEGVSVDPSAANGLVACQESGPEGIELGSRDQIDADRLAREGHVQEGEEMGPDGLVHPAPGHCPPGSQIGEVEVLTPLLAEPLKGHVYVAAPQCGDAGQPQCTPQSAEDGQLFGIYLEVAGSGIVVKLKGEASVSPQTGRVTTRFTETPQVPFSELKLKLNGGPRAPLANPQSCQPAQTMADFTPWSTPYTPDATPGSSFNVTGCTGAFSPSFLAGTTSPAAGAYAPFTLTFSRHDGEQDLSGLTVNMPEGLVGRIAGIAQCGEAEVRAAEANTGGCAAASRVGTATAAAGAGPTPFYQSGPVYLTGPYKGAPFGLAVVVPANAGPFHLGNIVVRAAIHINPQTAQVTVVSDPLPQLIDGVPLRVQTVNVTVGGEGTPFTFNSTSCNPQSITATLTSAQGASAPVSTPYQAQGCASLPFKPSFTVSTQGATSRSNGASLDVRIATKQGPGEPGGVEEANIRKVDVQLPLDLPSRLSTLQKACTERQFAANPAGCPEASFVGTAVAHTPLLPVPLEGPAILVSHGGAAFPNLELVLQGDGVVIDLTGNTQIKKGITYSRFESAPDAPFSSFELKLPEGPHSVLGSYVPSGGYSFCGLTRTVTTTRTVTKRVNGRSRRVRVKVKTTKPAALEMPTTITAQNGAVLKQTTKIAVTGCPGAAAARAAAAKKAAAARARHSSRGGKRR